MRKRRRGIVGYVNGVIWPADIRIEYPSQGCTYLRAEYGIYEYTTFGRGSVLEGQERRCFLASFPTLAEAQAAFPSAEVTGACYNPPDLSHLPDEEAD